ncbi:MAG TPA: DUF2851 family protein [Chloroflexia bacterium]|nr:DUF2851 family protein [Chloroflexia bacterium]
MPYDSEGKFVYPLPARARKPAAKKAPDPASTTVTQPEHRPKNSTTIEPAASKQVPPEKPLSPPAQVSSTSPELLPLPGGSTYFTVQEGSNRWQMSEIDLAQIWNSQLWPPGLELKTTSGQPVQVIYRGRWSSGFGPDFKGAMVRIGSELFKGDVELHLVSGDWRLHGHHQDQRYNQVVLQVTLEDNQGQTGKTLTQGGSVVPVVALLPLFKQKGVTLASSLEMARASGTRLGSLSESAGPCCERVAEHIPQLPHLLERLDRLGLERFDQRVSRFEAACALDPDSEQTQAAQSLWSGLLEALGYSNNKAPFRRLAEALPFSTLLELDREACRRKESPEERLLTLEAALLGTAGLLPSQRRLKTIVESRPVQAGFFAAEDYQEPPDQEDYLANRYTGELERRWNWLARHLAAVLPVPFQPLSERDWTFARLRPPNHPSRRIAGLARLLVRWQSGDESEFLALPGEILICTADSVSACERLRNHFQVPVQPEATDSDFFWSRRYDFSDRAILAGSGGKSPCPDLIGADRAADIVINILLPFLAGYGRDRRQSALVEAAINAYKVHPRLGSNELVENVSRQIFRYWLENPADMPPEFMSNGRPVLSRLINGACRQQGMIYLHHQFCSEQNYGACPLS